MEESLAPINLWNSSSTSTSDDAGTSIIKTILAPVPPKFPYPVPSTRLYNFVPSLSLLCILRVYTLPDQLHLLDGLRLNHNSPVICSEFDLLRALIPDFHPDHFCSTQLDPRLWVTLAQVYDSLPQSLRTYQIPLSDQHLPLLQRVKCTPSFSLITILDLAVCARLTDANIIQLKPLTSLTALDASSTNISDDGIRALAGTIVWSDQDKCYRGPSTLRILKLNSCRNITYRVFNAILKFPLLSLIDLRRTKCRPATGKYSPFRCTGNSSLFDTTMDQSLEQLAQCQPNLYSSSNAFTLDIRKLDHTLQSHRLPPPKSFGSLANRQPAILPWPIPTPQLYSSLCHEELFEDHGDIIPDDSEDSAGDDIDVTEHDEDLFLDFANAIVREEATMQSTKDRLASFYHQSPRCPLINPAMRGDVVRKPLMPSTNSFSTSGSEDCMLYRQPPPWSLLHGPSTLASFSDAPRGPAVASHPSVGRVPSNTALHGLATINSQKAEQMRLALSDWEDKRRALHSLQSAKAGPSTGGTLSKPSDLSTPRNPFVRQLGEDGNASETLHRRKSLPFRPPSTSGLGKLRRGPVPVGDDPQAMTVANTSTRLTAVKQLKPVSMLSIPLRPSTDSSARKETVNRLKNTPCRLLAIDRDDALPTDSISENEARRNCAKGKEKDGGLYSHMDATLARYSRRASLPAHFDSDDCDLDNQKTGSIKRLRIRADDCIPTKKSKVEPKRRATGSDSVRKTIPRQEGKYFDWKDWGSTRR